MSWAWEREAASGWSWCLGKKRSESSAPIESGKRNASKVAREVQPAKGKRAEVATQSRCRLEAQSLGPAGRGSRSGPQSGGQSAAARWPTGKAGPY